MKTSRLRARIGLWMPWFAQAKISIFFSCPMAVTALAAPTAKGGCRTFLCGICRESNLRTAMGIRPEEPQVIKKIAYVMRGKAAVLCRCQIILLLTLGSQAAETLRFGGEPAELRIDEVSERTIRIELAPLDERGIPRAEATSSDLVPFPSQEKLRIRELGSSKEIRAGKLRVRVQPNP